MSIWLSRVFWKGKCVIFFWPNFEFPFNVLSRFLPFLVFSLNSNVESHAHKFPIYFSNRMLYSLMSIGLLTFIFVHCEFLEYGNAQKSVWRIWECFSHLLDKTIPKIWKKLNPHDGFLSYLQNSTANSAHLEANFCPALLCPQKATMRI